MTNGFVRLLSLIALSATSGWSVCLAQGLTPQDIVAEPVDGGLRILSFVQNNIFSLTLKGHSIKPLSPDRLELEIDRQVVEIVTMPLSQDVGNLDNREVLATYKRWAEAQSKKEGWVVIPASETEFDIPDGRHSLLWQMWNPALESRIIGATTNNGNIIALVGGRGASDDFIRSTLNTLESQLPPGAAVNTANSHSGANLRGSLKLASAMSAREHRALLNEQLMSEADAALGAAIPANSDVLIEALQIAPPIIGALQKPPIIGALQKRPAERRGLVGVWVFDGRSAHAFNIEGYDSSTKEFVYIDNFAGRTSFLLAGKNAAGVSATREPNDSYRFRVKSDDLKRVLYTVILPFDDMSYLANTLPLHPFGGLGDRIDDVKRTELFTWFHFAEDENTYMDDDGFRVLGFRPSNANFRSLVELEVTVGKDGRINDATLVLLRSFIDNPATTVFARDLAKSFLRLATQVRDRVWIDPLANQIEYDVKGKITLRPAPALPEHPTPDYTVFLGKSKEVTQQLSLTELTLTNAAIDEKPALTISIATVR